MLTAYGTKALPVRSDAVAPDGSDVRVLLSLKAGGMAHFQLSPGEISTAVTHRTVEEIWYFISGRGQMWRRREGQEETTVDVEPGVCITIPLGTHFQFRASKDFPAALAAVGVTMPPWPGEGEAILVKGKWASTVPLRPKAIRKDDTESLKFGRTSIRQYFGEDHSRLGLASAEIEGEYPEKGWAINRHVDEIYYVVSGTAEVTVAEVNTLLSPGTAVFIPVGTKYRIAQARELVIVVPTAPAWWKEQHEILQE